MIYAPGTNQARLLRNAWRERDEAEAFIPFLFLLAFIPPIRHLYNYYLDQYNSATESIRSLGGPI